MINKSILTFFIIFSFGIEANNLEPISYWDIQSASSPIVSPDNSLIIFSKEYIDKKNDDFKYHHTPNDTFDKIIDEDMRYLTAAYSTIFYLAAEMPIDFRE